MKWNLMIFKTSKCTHNISFLYSFHVCPQTAHALREKFTESHALTIRSLSHPQLQPHQSARVSPDSALSYPTPPTLPWVSQTMAVLNGIGILSSLQNASLIAIETPGQYSGPPTLSVSFYFLLSVKKSHVQAKHGGNARSWIKRKQQHFSEEDFQCILLEVELSLLVWQIQKFTTAVLIASQFYTK